MIKDRSEMKRGPIEIDLSGPDGNAFVLIGIARRLARQLDYTKHEIEDLITEMKGSDYEYLLNTFDEHFGNHVILYR